MSKTIDQLTAEDFGKSFDTALFSEWKKSVEAHEKSGTVSIVLFVIGMALMILLGGFVGIGLFFALAFTGIAISMPKKAKRSRYQRELGITNKDVRDALAKSRNRTK